MIVNLKVNIFMLIRWCTNNGVGNKNAIKKNIEVWRGWKVRKDIEGNSIYSFKSLLVKNDSEQSSGINRDLKCCDCYDFHQNLQFRSESYSTDTDLSLRTDINWIPLYILRFEFILYFIKLIQYVLRAGWERFKMNNDGFAYFCRVCLLIDTPLI